MCDYAANSIAFENRYQLYGHLFLNYLKETECGLKRIIEARNEVPTRDDG